MSLRELTDLEMMRFYQKKRARQLSLAVNLLKTEFTRKGSLPDGKWVTELLSNCVTSMTEAFWDAAYTEFSKLRGARIQKDERKKGFARTGVTLTEDSLKHNYSAALTGFACGIIGHAFPTTESIAAMAGLRIPILEVGAGSAIFGKHLADRVDYIATDNGAEPCSNRFVTVEKLDGREAIRKYGEVYNPIAVLMSYPPTQANVSGKSSGVALPSGKSYGGHSPESYAMPVEVLREMEVGDTFYYIGKYRGQERGHILITGSPKFHDELDLNFKQIATVPLYRWYHGPDPDISIWRKQTRHPSNG